MPQSSESGPSRCEATRRPVLFVLNALGIGGSERKTVNVVNALHCRGQNVHLAYLDPRIPLLKMIDRRVPVTFLRRQGKLSLTAIWKLRRYIVRERISKIVCVSLYPFLYAEAAIALLPSSRRPSVILMVNLTEHPRRKDQLQMLLYGPLMRRAEKVIFGCQAQQEIWARRYGLLSDRCGVIYNGIDVERFSPDTTTDFSGKSVVREAADFVIGAIGTLWPNKNHIELIYALSKLKSKVPNARLVIAGEGPERSRLEAEIAERGLERSVVLLGEVEDVRPVLDAMDVFVLPSISETFSNAALEAMAMRKAVVLSNTGGIPEMVRNGVDGYLYDRGDVQALVEIIVRLAIEPGLRVAIGAKARETVLSRFTFERMVDEYGSL